MKDTINNIPNKNNKIFQCEEINKKDTEKLAYKEELKTYERLGAIQFQKTVFKVERLKFKILKKICPNFLTYFEKYLDWKKNRKISKIKKKANRRKNIEKNNPKLIKIYDKISLYQNRHKNKLEERKNHFRNKIKVSNPKLLNFYDKYFKSENPYKGLLPEEQIQIAIYLNKITKLAMRKEFYQEKNANYHMDSKRPTEIIKYLELNKKIHIHGLMGNALLVILLLVIGCLGFSKVIPLIGIELLSAGINFECINIQNYNLCRLKRKEEVLRKIEKKNIESSIRNTKESSKIIYDKIVSNENLPSITEIINGITDINQAKQFRAMLINSQKERKNDNIRRNVK